MFYSNAWDIEKNAFTDWFYDKNFIEIGNFSIAKYAVCILIGLILAYIICSKEGKRLGMDPDWILYQMAWIVPCCIIGARIWYIIGDGENTFEYFLNRDSNFFTALIHMIGFIFGFDSYGNFNGLSGLAIQGGIAVAFPLAYIVTKKKGYSFISIFDMLAPGFLIGQICGRWGNFFNQEAYGIVVGGWERIGSVLVPNLTAVEQWDILTKTYLIPEFIAKNMYIINPSDTYYFGLVDGVQTYATVIKGGFFYHPTFLYESLLNLVGLILYFILRRRKWVKEGYMGGFYLIWYGVVRFFIEYLRCDSLYLGSITFLKMAQLTSIIMIILGILLILYCRFIKKTRPIVDLINEQKEKK